MIQEWSSKNVTRMELQSLSVYLSVLVKEIQYCILPSEEMQLAAQWEGAPVSLSER
jgi:hypothetical protein